MKTQTIDARSSRTDAQASSARGRAAGALCAALLGGFLIWGALHENSRFLVKAQSFRSGKNYLRAAGADP